MNMRDAGIVYTLDALGVHHDALPPFLAIIDQIDAWQRDHPGRIAWCAPELKPLYMALGALYRQTFG